MITTYWGTEVHTTKGDGWAGKSVPLSVLPCLEPLWRKVASCCRASVLDTLGTREPLLLGYRDLLHMHPDYSRSLALILGTWKSGLGTSLQLGVLNGPHSIVTSVTAQA